MKKLIIFLAFCLLPFALQAQEYGGRDTVADAPDTLSRQIDTANGTANSLYQFFSQYNQGWIATDDTIIVSQDASFPANESWYIYPSESETLAKMPASDRPNLYWKVSGTGTATVRFKWW